MTRYAMCGELTIAYQVEGEGLLDLVLVPGLISHIEFFHRLPGYSNYVRRLAALPSVRVPTLAGVHGRARIEFESTVYST